MEEHSRQVKDTAQVNDAQVAAFVQVVELASKEILQHSIHQHDSASALARDLCAVLGKLCVEYADGTQRVVKEVLEATDRVHRLSTSQMRAQLEYVQQKRVEEQKALEMEVSDG